MGELFFFDQTEVDQFFALSANSISRRKAEVCLNMPVILRSTSRGVYSDVPFLRILSVAILLPEAPSVVLADMQHLMTLPCLATVVRHEFPGRLINLKHGER